MTPLRYASFPAAFALCSALTPLAHAADHSNLEEGLPTSLADATPLPFLGRELQLVFDYDRGGDGRDRLELEPRFEFGLFPNAQLALHAPITWGEGDEIELGNLSADALYNLNQESIAVPSVSLVGEIAAPTAPEEDTWRPSVKVFATKSIPYTTYWAQLHANAIYAFDPRPGRGAWQLKGGTSFRLTTSSMGILGYAWDQGGDGAQDTHWVEPGVRVQVTPLWVLSAGGGVGLRSEEGTAFRATVGIQWSGLYLPFW